MDASPPALPTHRLAAVLLLLYPHRGALYTVLTRRSSFLPRHQGEIALPGGNRQPEDPSFLATALRETREELGVPEADVRVVGGLEPVFTYTSGFLIYPFIGASPEQPRFRPDPGEVAEVIEVPVAALRDPAVFVEEERVIAGVRYWAPAFIYRGHRIWGATARIVQAYLASPWSRPEAWPLERGAE